jgi:hypothetical protein
VLTFAIVASKNGRPLDPSKLELFEARAAAEVPFPPDRYVTWTNDAGTVWFAGWQAPGRERPGETRWHVDAQGLTAYSGRVWPGRDGWSGPDPVAAELSQYLHRQPLVGHSDTLAGVYIVVAMSCGGTSWVAADPVGTALFYWATCPDVVVLSTRAAMAAALLAAVRGGTPRRDAVGVGWLAYAGIPMGLRTGFEDVKLVRDAAVVEIHPTGVDRAPSIAASAVAPSCR